MSILGNKLIEMFELMFNHQGPLNWWPGEDTFEIMIGAILTQNTAWKNVEKAITQMKEKKILSPEAILTIDEEELSQVIRPSGYHRIKAKRLKDFVKFIFEKYGANLIKMKTRPLYALRDELLSIKGIGAETADSILLYALEKPICVVDAYTKRILYRHKIISSSKDDYEDIQKLFMENLETDVALFNEFHAQIVNIGKNYCKREPKCELCPLKDFNLKR